MGFTAPPLAAAEVPLPACLVLEEEYRELRTNGAAKLTWLLRAEDVVDLAGLARQLDAARDPASEWLAGKLTAETARLGKGYVRSEAGAVDGAVRAALVRDLNAQLEAGALQKQPC